jgi:hypothetical protein
MADSFPEFIDAKLRYNLVIECSGKIGALMQDMGLTPEEALIVLAALSDSMQQIMKTKVVFCGPSESSTC